MIEICMPDGSTLDLCLLKPPEDPPTTLVSSEKVAQLKQKHHEVWSFYQDACVNNCTSTGPKTDVSTTTVSDTTTTIHGTTTFLNNTNTSGVITSNQDTALAGQDDNSMLHVLLYTVLAIFIVVVILVVLFVIHKKKPEFFSRFSKRSKYDVPQAPEEGREPDNIQTNLNRSMPTYSLDVHERINYVNNKAEQGERWSGLEDTNADEDRFQHNKVNVVRPIQVNNEKMDTINQEYLSDGLKNSYQNQVNGETESVVKLRHSHPLKQDGRQSEEHIYANHQFEKLVKRKSGHDNLSYSPGMDQKRKPVPNPGHQPPADKQTSDMYIIDDNPYDRVDFLGGKGITPTKQKERPVPAKRKRQSGMSLKADGTE